MKLYVAPPFYDLIFVSRYSKISGLKIKCSNSHSRMSHICEHGDDKLEMFQSYVLYSILHVTNSMERIPFLEIIHSFSSLSYDRSKASSKASSPHSAIQSFLLQMRVSSPFLKDI